jgi:TldD protein
LHEAVGHGLEGDFNRQGTSLYSGRIGERVASDLVTIYDDGDLPGERGSVTVDDEGTPGQHKTLVERGVLRGYMHDRHSAKSMGDVSTGSGRRQSYRVMPQPRMCNTFMPDGESTYDEIIGSVKRGIFASSFAGGQVEISRGDFVFMLAEGYLIEDGKLTAPLRGASLTGNGPEVMNRVTMVGNDGRFAGRYYTCGKGGQYVPVGVGMPTVKLSSVTVGGSGVG